MKIYISYFYAVRFFKPYQIPMSTAVWDPKWYQPPRGRLYHIDKRGVINGLKATPFALPHHSGDTPDCLICDKVPSHCAFIPKYKAHLDSLDFEDMIARIERLAREAVQLTADPDHEPEVVLLVHEAPSNPCSERGPLVDWFHKHGVTIEEYPIPSKK